MVQKGGSIASNSLMSQLPGNCGCANELFLPPIKGVVNNFHLTTGGGRNKKKSVKKSAKKSVKKSAKKSAKRKYNKHGGSVGSNMVMKATLSDCSTPIFLPNFPSHKGGMVPPQMNTNGNVVLKGVPDSCVKSSPMFQ